MPHLNLEKCIISERYKILSRLGIGSYAEIYRALDTDAGGQLVVLKALNVTLQGGHKDEELGQTLLENFSREARALDRLRHPNIVRRLDHGAAPCPGGDVLHYIILEYLPGGDLSKRCRLRPLSLQEIFHYIEQVCSALSYAHTAGVIHRDIKPNNLLLSADQSVVKVADFGIARIDYKSGEAVTRVGSDIYAPPEHHPLYNHTTDKASLTPSADIYSLAKTIYTLLSGTPPKEFLLKRVDELPQTLRGERWAAALLQILRKATESGPRERYQTVREFWDELMAVGVGDDFPTVVRREGAASPTGTLRPAAPEPHKVSPNRSRIVIPVVIREEDTPSTGEKQKPNLGERKMEIKGIEAQARPLPLVILADTSGSMANEKISSLNQALAALVQDLQSDDQTKESVLLSLVTFDSTVKEVVTLEPIKTVQLPKLTATGSTSMGQAFRVALSQLGDPQRLPARCLLPVIVVATDGQPTDDWRLPLQELKDHNRVGNALRLALAIGADADVGVLQEFVSTEYPVLKADEPDKIKSFFRFVTFRSKKVYQSGGRDRGGQDAPSDLLP